ncbi:MAG: CCA tRNA nucleotidyltransferase [Planctomycetota bacterium]
MSSASRRAALQVLRRLVDAGHTAYLAGGCVRDALLGLEPKDHDVATDAPPKVVRELWPNSQPVGQAFGVVLCYATVDRKRHAVEVATFRTEGVYSDGRRPDSVAYTTAEHDAKRRDFTINGLFADPLNQADKHEQTGAGTADTHTCPTTGDRVIDYVDGLPDLLKHKVIRAIGDPTQRFAEDYLRMLRAVRFAARLNFKLDPATARAIRDHAPKLNHIARERIGDEVKRALMSARPALAVRLFDELNLTPAVFGQPITPSEPDALAVLAALSPNADLATRIAVWTHGRTPPIEPRISRRALDLSNPLRDELLHTAKLRTALQGFAALGVAGRKRLLSHPRFEQTRLWARVGGLDPALAKRVDADHETLSNDGIGLAPPPLITGDDLVGLGLTPGPDFKRWLDDAYDAQLEGKIATREQALTRVRPDADTGSTGPG